MDSELDSQARGVHLFSKSLPRSKNSNFAKVYSYFRKFQSFSRANPPNFLTSLNWAPQLIKVVSISKHRQGPGVTQLGSDTLLDRQSYRVALFETIMFLLKLYYLIVIRTGWFPFSFYFAAHFHMVAIQFVDPESVSIMLYCACKSESFSAKRAKMSILSDSEFRQFDYGPAKNLVKYGSNSAPAYNLSHVTSPLYIFYAEDDEQAVPEVSEC